MFRPLIISIFAALVCSPIWAQDSSDPVAQALSQGRDLESKHKYQQALEAYEKADKLSHHTSAVAYLRIAGIERRQGRLSESLDDAKKAEKAAGDDKKLAIEAHSLRALILVHMSGKPTDKKLKEAEQELRAAIALAPEDPLSHFNLGFVLVRQERDEEGITELKIAANSPRAMASTVTEAKRIIASPVRAREPFAPGFSFTSLEDHDITSASLRGKVVLLDFWGTWCEPCRESIPMLRDLQKKFAKQDFQLVGISSDDSEDVVRKFAQQQHMDWAEGVDLHRTVLNAFHVDVYPTFVVMDKDGVIRYRQSGKSPMTGSELEEAIGKALKRAPDPKLAAAVSASEAASSPGGASGSREERAGAEGSASASPFSEVEAVSIHGRSYTNKGLGLTFELPSGWLVANPDEVHRGNDRAEAAALEVLVKQHPEMGASLVASMPKVVLYASPRGGGDGQSVSVPSLRMTARPSHGSSLNVDSFERAAQSLAAASGSIVARHAEMFTVKGHDFLRADISKSTGSSVVLEAIAQTIAGEYLVQIEIFASSNEELQRLADSLQSITITDSEP